MTLLHSFLKIYRNKVLRKQIFEYIREINRKLQYITFNYYEFPIESILRSNYKSMLIEKLNDYEKYIYSNNGNTQISDIYKYQLDINNSCLVQLLSWKELTVDLFKLFYKLFKFEIDYFNLSNYYYLLINTWNRKVLQYIIDSRISKSSVKTNYNIQDFQGIILNDNIKKTIKFFYWLKSYQQQQQQNQDGVVKEQQLSFNKGSFFNYLNSIIKGNKTKELGSLLFEVLSPNILKSIKSNEFSEYINQAIVNNDEAMVKLILSNFIDTSNSNNKEQIIQIYDIEISILTIREFNIKPRNLFSSTLTEFVLFLLNRYLDIYNCNEEEGYLKYKIYDPTIAEYIIESEFINQGIINETLIYFSHKCIKEDLSNIGKFKMVKNWIQDDYNDILNPSKLKWFTNNNIVLYDYNYKNSFNGDKELFKLFYKAGGGLNKYTNQTIKQASINGHNELLDYIFQPKVYSRIEHFQESKLFELSILNHGHWKLFTFLKINAINHLQKSDFIDSLMNNIPTEFKSRLEFFEKIYKIKEHQLFFKSHRLELLSILKLNNGYNQFDYKYRLYNSSPIISIIDNELNEYSIKDITALEKSNLIPILSIIGSTKLLESTLINYQFKDTFKVKIFENLSYKFKNQMILYLFYNGFFSIDFFLLKSNLFIKTCCQCNNFRLVELILVNLKFIAIKLSKKKPIEIFIYNDQILNNIHFQIFDQSLISEKKTVITHLVNLNYKYAPNSINIHKTDNKPSSFPSVFTQFTKNVGLFDYLENS